MNHIKTLELMQEQIAKVQKLFKEEVTLTTLIGDEFPWENLATAYASSSNSVVTLLQNLWAISMQTATAAYLKGYKDANNKKSTDELEKMFNQTDSIGE